MKILGVDPGIRGGIAVVLLEPGAAPVLVDAIDIPIVGVKAKERIDCAAMRQFIELHRPQHAVIERAQSMPRQGSSSGFKYGRAVGAIEAAIVLSGVPMTIVEAATWKRFHRLYGTDKEASRQRALQLFPASHSLLARKKDHGRGEAALLAIYGGSLGVLR